MKRQAKRTPIIIVSLLIVVGVIVYISPGVGKELDSYKGVAVYGNGLIVARSFGMNFSDDGCYFGQRWQCVEYVKRFYFQAKNHKMPEVYGNAKDFFDYSISHGERNENRGLVQYYNGNDVPTQADDVLVFTDRAYGHVAVVTGVGEGYIEVIRQNMRGKVREQIPIKEENGDFFVGEEREPAGWLRFEG
ncbi:MAG: CHAP domain-containing protein [Clostridiales Family XIII bacterium]|nr:CHAP domain-containing protein [Clostridiales Family XIII bacterium]